MQIRGCTDPPSAHRTSALFLVTLSRAPSLGGEGALVDQRARDKGRDAEADSAGERVTRAENCEVEPKVNTLVDLVPSSRREECSAPSVSSSSPSSSTPFTH